MTNGFRITVRARPGEVEGVNAAFAEFADAHALPASVRRSLSVALDELLANAMEHGFRGREAGGAVTVEMELHSDQVSVIITDNGPPFDPFAGVAPDTTLPVAERPIGGLGLHLVRGMMDEVRYQRRGDRNVVVLAKRLTAEGEP